ncbi:MAG: DUF2239 family protein [Blastomonas sp.]|nr:DUF2239 family protein [Blastomonas sp.]
MSNVTAFQHGKQIASGERDEVARALSQALSEQDGTILVFEDSTGRVTDLDYRNIAPRTAGRPKLGVQAREVTLLPRHWDWLASQSGGASAALRRLIDQERGNGRTERESRDAAYRFMQAACGDMPHYEEALRALYSERPDEFHDLISPWPADIVRYVTGLLGGQETGA